MNFDFSEEDKLVQEQTSRLLQDHCGMDVVRRTLEGENTHAAGVWQKLGELGLTGTAVPEAHGGVEAGYLPLCLVAQELGRHVAPVPFSSSIYLAAEALLRFGSAAQQERWLPKLAAGEVVGTVAVSEGLTEVAGAELACTMSGDSVNGTKQPVADGNVADLAVVLVGTDAGPSLALVDLAADGVTRTVLETVDPTRDTAKLDFANVDAEVLGEPGQGWQQLAVLYDRAAVLFAFEQIGGAEAALDMAVAYANERFAFGRPIGSFQALKHMMADMYVALKLAESNCYYAAWALASDAPELPLAARTARVSATQAYQLCSRDNIQVHGGMGFTWEFDCHLYYRRSNYLTLQLGGLSVWENKLVDALQQAA